MKKIITKKTTAVLLAVILCLTVSIGATVAYFSDYEDASGGATISLGGETKLIENTADDNKAIQIENTGSKTSMIVRVAIFGSDEFMNVTYDENDWVKKGDFYYYTKVLLPKKEGETENPNSITSVIKAEVEQKWEGKVRPDYDFDVTVVHESAQAVYDVVRDEDGNKKDILVTPDGWDDITNIINAPKPGKGE